MLSAYGTTALGSRSFTADLGASYAEFGRVEVRDQREPRQVYVLRSQARLKIERAMSNELFDSTRYLVSDALLLVHEFNPAGLSLSLAGAKHQIGKKKLLQTGPPVHVGTWLFEGPEPGDGQQLGAPSDGSDGGSFDQGAIDAFAELGDLDIGEPGTEAV